MLNGKTVLIVGVANEHSIAYGCARAFADAGARLCITYETERHLPYVQPLMASLGSPLLLKCDVTKDEELTRVYQEIGDYLGRLDSVVHSVAFAPREDLHGRVVDSSAEGFAKAMNISCHSFIRMARLAEPVMNEGGSLFTMSYYGAEKVMEGYGVMGPVKAALEASVRYLAAELGPKRIRVNAISPGPLQTRAASGLKTFERLLAQAAERAPMHQTITIEEVGRTVAMLADDNFARHITGQVLYIDGGYHIMG